MSMTSYKIGKVHFRLLGANGFDVKAKNGRFAAAASSSRQNLEYENFTWLFGRLRQKIVAKSVPQVQRDYFFLFILFNELNSLLYRRRQKTMI